MVYRTNYGDRWDAISYKFYGHPDYYWEIIKANPGISDEVRQAMIMPAGIKLTIPDLTVETAYPDDIAPWKKA